MLRLIVISLLALFICTCTSSSANQNTTVAENQDMKPLTKVSEIDGVYEFVSETTVKTFPEESTVRRQNDAWKGYWFFQNGHFSKVLVKNERPEWTPGKFPSDARGTGFDAASGTYRIDGDNIEMNYILTYYPGMAYDLEFISYGINDGVLTMTRKFAPRRESMAKGEQVIVLQKVN